MKNAKNIGFIGEQMAQLQLLKIGVQIYTALEDNYTQDGVILYKDKLYKYQVKSTNSISRHNTYQFDLTSNNWYKKEIYKYTKKDIDLFFLVYIPKELVFVHKHTDKGALSIRNMQSKNRNRNQHIINYAYNYELNEYNLRKEIGLNLTGYTNQSTLFSQHDQEQVTYTPQPRTNAQIKAHTASRKVERPSIEELIDQLSTSSYVAVGRSYGVSDNAVRKWVKTYGYNPKTLTPINSP